MVKLRPHSATLSWSSGVTHDSNGVPSEGGSTNKSIDCLIQPRTQSARYIVADNGDKIGIKFVIFASLFTEASTIASAKGATITLPDGIEYKVIRLDVFQKHVEIVC